MRNILFRNTRYDASSMSAYIYATIFLHVTADVQYQSVLVCVIIDPYPRSGNVVGTEESVFAVYHTYDI